MTTYLFDVTIQGMVVADTRADAIRYIHGIGRDDICVDIDDFVDLKLQASTPEPHEEL